MAKQSTNKVQIKVSFTGPVSAALKAIAKLEGREISDILEEAARNVLRDRGVEPKASASEIAAEMKQQEKARHKTV